MTHIARTRRLLVVVGMTAVMPFAAACSSATAPSTATASSAASSAAASAAASATAGTEAAGDYCDVLKNGQKELEGLSGSLTDSAALEKGLSVIRRIQASAPPEVKQAWTDFVGFVEAASSSNTSALTDAMTKMEAAGATIEAHAKTACNLSLQ
ncbi:hypothetical protein [Humibacillus xanthopallidus]|uniref:Lipoprotein n=1 Tax=Humibacillus xanthopallidus TaxID=412689 RepID=A0A543HJ05_9MICO|nr:hypothetical protein [Humibacillus xanthopallidus]TQM58323.1 hypothetical protein FBY41_3686 [Humibacillus xanthopallidus]